MVLDAGSRRIVDGVIKEDDILKENVTSRLEIERQGACWTLSKGQT